MSSLTSTKNSPVLNRLHECLEQALAYANAIRDNAQDDRQPINREELSAVWRTCAAISDAVTTAACVK